MPRGKPLDGSKNPGGRPKIPIDYDQVEKLASIMCTQEEIAAWMDCNVLTLQRDEKFCSIYKRGIEKGKMSVRRQQYKLSEAGNATMAIWLGKQYLGQRDKQDIEHSGEMTVNNKTELYEKYLKED
jgi:hypothetical protein